MRELRAQATLPRELEATELSQGQSLEWSMWAPCITTLAPGIRFNAGANRDPVLNGPLMVLCRASYIPGHLDWAENTLTTANYQPLLPRKQLLKSTPQNLLMAKALTSPSPICAVVCSGTTQPWVTVSINILGWFSLCTCSLGVVYINSCLALKYLFSSKTLFFPVRGCVDFFYLLWWKVHYSNNGPCRSSTEKWVYFDIRTLFDSFIHSYTYIQI